MDILCRICRHTEENAHLKSMMISGLLEIYSFCTNIPITEDSEKCYKVCEQCAELLIRFNEFKKLCIESDNYFKQNACVQVKVEFLNDPLQSLNEKLIVKDEQFSESDQYEENYESKNNQGSHKKHASLKSQVHCKFCSKKFVYAASLKKHYLKSHKFADQDEKINVLMNEFKVDIDKLSKKYACKSFSDPVDRNLKNEHILREKLHVCSQCDKKYMDAASLKTHTIKIHLTPKKFPCYFCSERFHRKKELKSHLKTHPSEKPFECDLCQKKFSSKSSLSKHLENHLNSYEQCKICKERFTNKPDYRNHILTHMEDDPYKCKICESDFIYLNSFKQHIKENHPGKLIEECIENPQQLLSGNGALNESLPSRIAPVKRKSPPPESEKKYVCNFCGKRFMSNCSLDDHIRVHTGEKPFACDKCDFKCRNKGQLSFHQQRKHEKMPRYSCSYCSYQTYTNNQLTRHITSHFDEKPFICDVCDAAFKMRKSLIVHKRSHTGERPYRCTYCDRDFASLSYLKGHLPVHTGERKFVCKICDKKFTQRTPLIRHMETHKNMNKSIKSSTSSEVKHINTFYF